MTTEGSCFGDQDAAAKVGRGQRGQKPLARLAVAPGGAQGWPGGSGAQAVGSPRG